MSQLLPGLPAALVASSFARDAEGWAIGDYPGPANERAARWSAGAIGHTAGPDESTWSFSAPAVFRQAAAGSYGGLLAFVIDPGSPGATLVGGSTNLVLAGATTRL